MVETIKLSLKYSKMSNQGIKKTVLTDQAMDQTKERMKWEKAGNKIEIECWIRSEPTERKYRQRMKKIWNKIGVFPVTEQRLADQAGQIRKDKWLAEIEIEKIRTKLERNNSKMEVQENN